MEEKKEKLREVTNVEFGIEFGDLNGAKFYEFPYSNQNEKDDSQKNRSDKK
ncbi:MAG TPA: hypothetical protein VEV44_15870 [Pseudoneobacillus sp.]|nr:hypothetical protein [Pseudoneobacillus sp.]